MPHNNLKTAQQGLFRNVNYYLIRKCVWWLSIGTQCSYIKSINNLSIPDYQFICNNRMVAINCAVTWTCATGKPCFVLIKFSFKCQNVNQTIRVRKNTVKNLLWVIRFSALLTTVITIFFGCTSLTVKFSFLYQC